MDTDEQLIQDAQGPPLDIDSLRSRSPERLHIDDLRTSQSSSSSSDDTRYYHGPVRPQQQQQQFTLSPPSSMQSSSAINTPILEQRPSSYLQQLAAALWPPVGGPSRDTDYLQQSPPAPPPVRGQPAHGDYRAPQRTPPAPQHQPSNVRTFDNMLPRRSGLVPHDHRLLSPVGFAIGRHTLDPEAMFVAPERNTSPSMAHMNELRPVPSPALAAEANANNAQLGALESDDDELSGAVSTAPSSEQHPSDLEGARLRRDFAAKRVRFQDSWRADMQTYMKNAHPFLGICCAHPRHPYKRRDRILVLVVALLVLLLCSGVFATQPCCESVQDVPVAVVEHRRLAHSQVVETHRVARALTRAASLAKEVSTQQYQCLPFNSTCSSATALCTEGSSCARPSGAAALSTKQCVPAVAGATASAMSCRLGSAQCPPGWICDPTATTCAPASSLVCYVPRDQSPPSTRDSELRFAASDRASSTDGSGNSGMTVIEAIFGILIIANGNGTTAPTPAPSTNAPTPTPSPLTPSPSATESVPPATAAPITTDPTATLQSIAVTLSQPEDGGVYSVTSTMPIEWTVSVASDADADALQLLKAFTVTFSADGGKTFATIADDVRAASARGRAATAAVFHYDWRLGGNTSLVCTACVLRVCADVQSTSSMRTSGSASQVCIRSDGGATPNTLTAAATTFVTSATASARRGITFRIVREILACTCGVAHAPFVEMSYVIALSLPLALLLLEQLVTFYEDAKFCGLVARHQRYRSSTIDDTRCALPRGPTGRKPLLGYYSARRATRAGRVAVVLVLAGVCIGSGVAFARITEANFLTQTTRILGLWLATFGVCLAVGFVYTSVLYLARFALRWAREPSPLKQRLQARPLSPPSQSDQLSELALTQHQLQHPPRRLDFSAL